MVVMLSGFRFFFIEGGIRILPISDLTCNSDYEAYLEYILYIIYLRCIINSIINWISYQRPFHNLFQLV